MPGKAAPSLRLAFISEFERTFALLMRHAQLGVIYDVRGDELRVVALAHHRRRPEYWERRK